MKKLLILMTFLSGYFACHAQPGPAYYLQDLPETLHGIPMGADVEKMAEMLEQAGFKKIDVVDYFVKIGNAQNIEVSLEKQEEVRSSVKENILKIDGSGFWYSYVFQGNYMGMDDSYIALLTTAENKAVWQISILWFKSDMSSNLQLYTKLHDILIEKYSDCRDFSSYEGYIKGMSSDQVLKYLESGNKVSFEITIPQGNDAMFNLLMSPKVVLHLNVFGSEIVYANPIVGAIAG